MLGATATVYEKNKNMIFPLKLGSQLVYQVLKNCHDPKFKTAAMTPIYGKKHSNHFFSRPTGLIWPIFSNKNMGHHPI